MRDLRGKLFCMQVESVGSLRGAGIARVLGKRPYYFSLDSGRFCSENGRFSFFGADPFLVIKAKGELISIEDSAGDVRYEQGKILDVLQGLLREYGIVNNTSFPFIGGGVGFIGYEVGRQLEVLPKKAVDDRGLEDVIIGFYDGIVVIDHELDETFIIALGLLKDAAERVREIKGMLFDDGLLRGVVAIEELEEGDERESSFGINRMYDGSLLERSFFECNTTKLDYLKKLAVIKEYLVAGDVYEVNFSQRFECVVDVDPQVLYQKILERNPVSFGVYMDFGAWQLLSASPERFLKKRGNRIGACPIKGTRPRGATAEVDEQLRQELMDSEKDKAELRMIVDLVRNDFGKVCEYGSVKVKQVFAITAHPGVYHQDALIEGVLREGLDVIDAVKATFPGGSITGAPKVRSMEIIDELEPTTRGVYTGIIGYMSFCGNADFNIGIRTLVCANKKAYLQVGGAIVWDSDSEEEYKETLHKGRILAQLLAEEAVDVCSR